MDLEIQSSPATIGTPASGQPDPLLGTVDAGNGAALGGSASPIQTATVQQVNGFREGDATGIASIPYACSCPNG